ncbi:MAG: dTDP-glucose 4,6-dehydratase [Candidatus Binatia bacterium]
MVNICVSGAAGFIGSNFVRRVLQTGDCSVVALDALTYSGNLANLAGLENTGRFRFVHGSICDPDAVNDAVRGCGAIVNFAAETHVDRSITDPGVFIDSNVQGVRVLVEVAVRDGLRLIQVSTDEVYGSVAGEGHSSEDSPLDPSSPYAASKASADLLVTASIKTYDLDAVITRCGNNYGPRQFPEKLIPLFVSNALDDEPLPLYGDGLNVRDWIHVDDHCDAIRLVLEKGEKGRIYNVSAGTRVTNLEVCERILSATGRSRSLIRMVDDRPGHDRRYALDASRIRNELGWRARIEFDAGLASTVTWYRENRRWWEEIKSGEYRRYYDELYGQRLSTSRDVGDAGGE